MSNSNSNSIYIVVGSGGQYDYAWKSNLIATFDKNVAEKYIADEPIRKNLWKNYGNKFNEMMNNWSELYEKRNPTPMWDGKHSSPAIEQWNEARHELYEAYKVIAAESFGLDLTMDYYQEEDLEENVYLSIEEVRIL